MKVRILFFAQLRDLFKKDEEIFNIPEGWKISQLTEALFKETENPELKNLPLLYAVNECYAKDAQILHAQDTVALIPPIAGG